MLGAFWYEKLHAHLTISLAQSKNEKYESTVVVFEKLRIPTYNLHDLEDLTHSFIVMQHLLFISVIFVLGQNFETRL